MSDFKTTSGHELLYNLITLGSNINDLLGPDILEQEIIVHHCNDDDIYIGLLISIDLTQPDYKEVTILIEMVDNIFAELKMITPRENKAKASIEVTLDPDDLYHVEYIDKITAKNGEVIQGLFNKVTETGYDFIEVGEPNATLKSIPS